LRRCFETFSGSPLFHVSGKTMNFAFRTGLPQAWQKLSRRLLETAPALTKAGRLKQLFQIRPRPLIHPDARMIVIFSPKSACSSVAIWFFHQLGQAEAARKVSEWPHQYRRQYYRSDLYQKAFDLDLSSFAAVRVVRDPFDRAVSSFRHGLRSHLTDHHLAKFVGRSNLAINGLSFSEFLDALERCDLRTCNSHFRIQKHPLEDVIPVRHLINVSTQDLFTRLNEVERDIGLPVTDFAKLSWLNKLGDSRSHGNRTCEVADAYTHPFTQKLARRGPWPSYQAFLTPTARERIARLYAVDIDTYVKHPGVAPAP
jgi:hypothetical protein